MGCEVVAKFLLQSFGKISVATGTNVYSRQSFLLGDRSLHVEEAIFQKVLDKMFKISKVRSHATRFCEENMAL